MVEATLLEEAAPNVLVFVGFHELLDRTSCLVLEIALLFDVWEIHADRLALQHIDSCRPAESDESWKAKHAIHIVLEERLGLRVTRIAAAKVLVSGCESFGEHPDTQRMVTCYFGTDTCSRHDRVSGISFLSDGYLEVGEQSRQLGLILLQSPC